MLILPSGSSAFTDAGTTGLRNIRKSVSSVIQQQKIRNCVIRNIDVDIIVPIDIRREHRESFPALWQPELLRSGRNAGLGTWDVIGGASKNFANFL
jgi:hypothetical protein